MKKEDLMRWYDHNIQETTKATRTHRMLCQMRNGKANLDSFMRFKEAGVPGKTLFIDDVECRILEDAIGNVTPEIRSQIFGCVIERADKQKQLLYMQPAIDCAANHWTPIAIRTLSKHFIKVSPFKYYAKYHEHQEPIPCFVAIDEYDQVFHRAKQTKTEASYSIADKIKKYQKKGEDRIPRL